MTILPQQVWRISFTFNVVAIAFSTETGINGDLGTLIVEITVGSYVPNNAIFILGLPKTTDNYAGYGLSTKVPIIPGCTSSCSVTGITTEVYYVLLRFLVTSFIGVRLFHKLLFFIDCYLLDYLWYSIHSDCKQLLRLSSRRNCYN